MADVDFPVPVEVPWKLASTTQLLTPGGPDETTISLFFHEPAEESLVGADAEEKLVFVKVTASVSPCRLDSTDPELASAFLADNLPVLHLQLDLRVSPESGETGGIRPYFHAAQPLHRRFVETGVVGNNLVEGAADAQFFGKSGSHLYENVDTSSRTTTAGGGLSFSIPLTPISVGGSVQTTGTDVSSTRTVDQVVDTTTREASQERRELVSHTTRVENVLTLLSGKYVGTPYLRFSLFPRPLQLLSLDPADPNLWFGQLLRQRSSGIEGIQEFTAVLVVPRGMEFCVEAKLRRVCLLDDPPGPPDFGERFRADFVQLARMAEYIHDIYPIGTPLDDLDVDLVSQLTPAKDFRRPVLRQWAFRLGTQVIEALVLSPADIGGLVRGASVNYKHMLEVWLETLHDEYERELVRSPLERGAVLGEDRRLVTCFSDGETGLEVSSSSRSVRPLVPIDFGGRFDVEITDAVLARSTVRGRATQTVTRWNALERRMNDFLSNLDGLPEGPSPLEDRRVIDVVISRWAKLSPGDARNLALDVAAKKLGLGREQRDSLAAAGVTDLRGLARSLRAVPTVERFNDEVARVEQEVQTDDCDKSAKRLLDIVLPDPLELPMDSGGARALRRSIAGAIGGTTFEPAPRPDDPGEIGARRSTRGPASKKKTAAKKKAEKKAAKKPGKKKRPPKKDS